MNNSNKSVEEEDQPPIMGTWNRLYLLILFMHALIIIFFLFFTKTFS